MLAVIAYFAFNQEKRLFPKEDANFNVENTEKVTKIFLSDPGVGNIRLTKNEDGIWIVNDSFRARQDWVVFLLDGMKHQKASQMVPQSMHNGAIKQLAGNSVKCEVFQGDKKTNAFYVSKSPSKDNLTVMLNIKPNGKNAERPFLVKNGNRSTFLAVRYGTELEDWRDKQILYFPKKEIKSISVEYLREPKSNYTLNVNPTISLMPGNVEGDALNELRIGKYLSFYDNLYCFGFENDYILKDTFLKAFTSFANIKVTSINGDVKNIDLYYRQVHKGTDGIIEVEGEQYDADSFFGYMNNTDLILLSSETLGRILQRHDDFLAVNAPPKTTE